MFYTNPIFILTQHQYIFAQKNTGRYVHQPVWKDFP